MTSTQDEVERHLAHPTRAQRPLHRVIYGVLSEYRMTNMHYEDGDAGFPLVDLMSNDPPADIGTGQMEMVWLTDEIVEAIEASLPAPDTAVKGCGYGTCNRCYRDTCRHFPQAPEAPSEQEADRNLERLIADLRSYAEPSSGSLRIDMSDVKSILALYDRARKIGGAS